MTLPSTEMASSPTALTSASKVPRMESYLRRWEACLTPPVSLTTMTSKGESFLPCQHLKKFLPILPNPFMATFSFASVTPFLYPPLLLPTFTIIIHKSQVPPPTQEATLYIFPSAQHNIVYQCSLKSYEKCCMGSIFDFTKLVSSIPCVSVQ